MIERKEVEYAKETNDILSLMIELMRVIKEKGDYTTLMDELMAAISGVDGVLEESKDMKILLNTIGMRVGDIAEVFTAKK